MRYLLQIIVIVCIASNATSIQAQKSCRTDEIYQQHLSDPAIGPILKHQDALLEKEILNKSGITIYTMRDIDEHGINHIARKALKQLKHLPGIHVSLDFDGIDPMEAPGVGTPAPGGLTYREAHLVMEIIADSKRLSSLDIVEINPFLDNHNQTGKMAVELAVSLFGKTIL